MTPHTDPATTTAAGTPENHPASAPDHEGAPEAPMTGRARFLAAVHGRPVDHVPVWFMRQAGRHLPEYRALRKDTDFWSALTDPDTARTITLQPVERYGVDAAVLFSDILVPLPETGAPVRFVPGKGPRLDSPVRTAEDVDRLTPPESATPLRFVHDACRAVREAAPDTAVVGFSGAPFTLAAYMVEGGGSKDWAKTRAFLASEPEAFDRLLAITTKAAMAQLDAQATAGADALQVFDSWAEVLDAALYRERVLPHVRRLVDHIHGHGLPCVLFAKGSPHILPVLHDAGAEMVGVDWRMPLAEARRILGPVALQGNIDPALMAAPPEVAVAAAERAIVEAAEAPGGHVLNTGHGLSPDARTETVAAVVHHAHTRPAPRPRPRSQE